MSKIKKTLSESVTYKYDDDTTYGYNRSITIIEKRQPNESQEEKEQDVVENYYRRIYSEWDCTGQWFTMRHELMRARDCWVIVLEEAVDC